MAIDLAIRLGGQSPRALTARDAPDPGMRPIRW
jgi:hypothetical protein